MIPIADAGLTRRHFLQIGGLGAFGLSVGAFFGARETQAAPVASTGFGQAQACILLFPYGSPPQHETFDPKPDAPPEIQGSMKSIPTCLPGVRVGEGIPDVAAVMDRLCVVRSVTHPYPEHGVAYAVSGIPVYTPDLETKPRDPRHWPFIGSIVDYLNEKQAHGIAPPVPRNIGLPWLLNSKTDLNVSAGPYAAFLGQAYDPVWADYEGKGTRLAPKYTPDQAREFLDPFAGNTADGRFRLSSAGQLPDDLPVERVNLRRSLLTQFDRARAQLDNQAFDRFQQMAYALVMSNKMRDALDVARESLAIRETYGWTLFGQACL